MTEWRDDIGIIHYSNAKLGIEDSENPTDSHFHPEGKEKRVRTWGENLGWEVGYRDTFVIYEHTMEGFRIIVEDKNPGALTGAHPSKVVYLNAETNGNLLA